MQQIFGWVLRDETSCDIEHTLNSAGWQKISAIPFARLQRRIEINALNTVFGILTRPVYQVLFSYYRASSIHHNSRNIDVSFLLSRGVTAVRGWRHPDHPQITLFATQHHQSGGAAPDWAYMGVWVFGPGTPTGLDTDLLIPTDQFENIFNGEGRSCRTPSGKYNGANHSWHRSKETAFGAVFKTGAYGYKSGCKFRVARFVDQLLSGWALPKLPTLYSAERFFTNYN
ncbi:MAG: hypothetical protein AAFQ58_14420 [Pseudomonadota bacterium]